MKSTTLFKDTLRLLKVAEKRKHEFVAKPQQLKKRLEIAKNALETPDDRWDYNEIKKDIEEIEWEIRNHDKEKRKHQGRPPQMLTQEEVLTVVDEYKRDLAKVQERYEEQKKKAIIITGKFEREITPLLHELQELEASARRARDIVSELPYEIAKDLPRFKPVEKKGHSIAAVMLRLLTMVNKKVGGVL